MQKNRRVAGYVTILTTQRMNKKTSDLGIFFVENRLNYFQVMPDKPETLRYLNTKANKAFSMATYSNDTNFSRLFYKG